MLRSIAFLFLGMLIHANWDVIWEALKVYTPIAAEYVVTYVPVVYTATMDLIN